MITFQDVMQRIRQSIMAQQKKEKSGANKTRCEQLS